MFIIEIKVINFRVLSSFWLPPVSDRRCIFTFSRSRMLNFLKNIYPSADLISSKNSNGQHNHFFNPQRHPTKGQTLFWRLNLRTDKTVSRLVCRRFSQKTNKWFFSYCFLLFMAKKNKFIHSCHFLGESTEHKSDYGFIWSLVSGTSYEAS